MLGIYFAAKYTPFVFQNAQLLNAVSAAAAAAAAPPSPPQPLLLGPTEVVKSSGTFPAPTKIPGRNYYNDEVVIRNSDSGKGEIPNIFIRA